MVKALIYKDATTRILRVVCLLAMCWVSLVYTVALMPISLDASGTNPLTVESSTTLASQALVIIAAALAIIEINSGETAIAALLVGSRRRMAFSLMTAKVVSIVVVGLMLTMVNAIGNFIAYGHGVSGRLMIRYMMLVVMNGVAVLSLSLLAGNVLLGLSIYLAGSSDRRNAWLTDGRARWTGGCSRAWSTRRVARCARRGDAGTSSISRRA